MTEYQPGYPINLRAQPELPLTTFDVFLESGVSVELPAGLDPQSDGFRQRLREAARAKFLAMLSGDGFDLAWEPHDEPEHRDN